MEDEFSEARTWSLAYSSFTRSSNGRTPRTSSSLLQTSVEIDSILSRPFRAPSASSYVYESCVLPANVCTANSRSISTHQWPLSRHPNTPSAIPSLCPFHLCRRIGIAPYPRLIDRIVAWSSSKRSSSKSINQLDTRLETNNL